MTDVLDEFDRPNLTLDELWEFLYFDNELPVTRRQLRDATLCRDLVPTRLSNKNYYTRRQGLDWVLAQRDRPRGNGKRRARAAESGSTTP